MRRTEGSATCCRQVSAPFRTIMMTLFGPIGEGRPDRPARQSYRRPTIMDRFPLCRAAASMGRREVVEPPAPLNFDRFSIGQPSVFPPPVAMMIVLAVDSAPPLSIIRRQTGARRSEDALRLWRSAPARRIFSACVKRTCGEFLAGDGPKEIRDSFRCALLEPGLTARRVRFRSSARRDLPTARTPRRQVRLVPHRRSRHHVRLGSHRYRSRH